MSVDRRRLIVGDRSLPTSGGIFLSLRNADKAEGVSIAARLRQMGFKIYATGGTSRALQAAGIECERVFKVREGRPDVVDRIKNGDIHLLINTPLGKKAQYDEAAMRLAGLRFGVPCITNLQAAKVVPAAIRSLRAGELRAIKLQEIAR